MAFHTQWNRQSFSTPCPLVLGPATRCVAMADWRHYKAPRCCCGRQSNGEVPEWSIGAVSKTVVPLGVPRVRIPASPPLL